MIHRSFLYFLGAKVKNKSKKRRNPIIVKPPLGTLGGKLLRKYAIW